jgi:hypothetical protein
MFGIIVTIIHLLLCLVISYGVLFSQTATQAFAVLSCLVVLLLMIRFFKCCILTPLESDIGTSKMGRAFFVKNFEHIALSDTEEIAVCSMLLLQVIRVATIVIIPRQLLF